jgi:hypothetical protein
MKRIAVLSSLTVLLIILAPAEAESPAAHRRFGQLRRQHGFQ